MASAILWLRNDLRLHDHEALTRALEENDQIIPLYCLDPQQLQPTTLGWPRMGIHRIRFLLESLVDLKEQLSKLGGNILVKRGKPKHIISHLIQTYSISQVYAHQEVASEEVKDEKAVAQLLAQHHIPFHLIWTKTLYHMGDVPFKPEKTPLTFKTFRTKCTQQANIRKEFPTPQEIPVPDYVKDWGEVPSMESLTIGHIRPNKIDPQDTQYYSPIYQGGETQALERIAYYTFESQLLSKYKYTRNQSLGTDYSSKLSPWLAHGCISPRRIYWTVKKYEQEVKKNISTWWLIFELIWRDYFKFLAIRFGTRMFHVGGIRDRSVSFHDDHSLFEKWKNGQTGIPFVDAHMRELIHTGFISNRGRVNCASFLARDYQVNWTWGAAWFEHLLIDYDVCSNWINWNFQATEVWYTNPVNQGLKYDKKGEYVSQWIPELAHLPGPIIHAPWLLAEEPFSNIVLSFSDSVPIPYPQPVHIYPKWNRAIQAIRKSSQKLVT